MTKELARERERSLFLYYLQAWISDLSLLCSCSFQFVFHWMISSEYLLCFHTFQISDELTTCHQFTHPSGSSPFCPYQLVLCTTSKDSLDISFFFSGFFLSFCLSSWTFITGFYFSFLTRVNLVGPPPLLHSLLLSLSLKSWCLLGTYLYLICVYLVYTYCRSLEKQLGKWRQWQICTKERQKWLDSLMPLSPYLVGICFIYITLQS